MNLLSHLRRRNRHLGRLIISGFLVVWLNMALQPCLMAAEPMTGHGDHDCPHCPDVVTHCDEESTARCAWVDAYDYDGRQGSADPSASGAWLAPALVSAPEPAWSGRPAPPRPPPQPPPPDAPLHLIHCIQLK